MLSKVVPDEGIEPPTFGLQNYVTSPEQARCIAQKRLCRSAYPVIRAVQLCPSLTPKGDTLTSTMTTNEVQLETNKRILDEYFEDGKSQAHLSEAYGRSPTAIYRLIRSETNTGRVRKKKPSMATDPRRKENQKPISAIHARLGLLITRFRVERKLNYTALGGKFEVSRIRASQLETGSYDFTLSELLGYCKVLSMKIESVLGDPDDRSHRA